MPIEGHLVYEDNWDDEHQLPTIEPGKWVKVASDFSGNEERLIMAHCRTDNKGGDIYAIDTAGANLLIQGSSSLEDLKQSKLGSVSDTRFERTIKTHDGRIARLVLKLTTDSIG